jgi:hypothetical protein
MKKIYQNIKQVQVRLTSLNEDELIQPSELLLPLNGFVNLINQMQDFDILYNEYQQRQLARNNQPDFNRYVSFRFFENKHRINVRNEQNHVMIKAMNKKSPYWVDLIVNASPYIIKAIQIIIETHENELEVKLSQVLNHLNWFSNLTVEQKNDLIKRIISNTRSILKFVKIVIDFTNNNED